MKNEGIPLNAVPSQTGCKRLLSLTVIRYPNIIQKHVFMHKLMQKGEKIKENEIVSWE